MKRTFTSFLFLLLSLYGFSGNWVQISSPDPVAASVKLVSSNIDNSVIQLNLGGFSLREVQTPSGPAVIVEAGGLTPIQEAGSPDLPKMTASLAIPDMAGMGVRILSSDFKDFTNILVAPSKGVIMRDVDPSTVPYTYGAVYSADGFFPGCLTGTRDPFIIRDVRGQTVIAYPFQYNPLTKTLRVYYSLKVELYKSGVRGQNTLPRNITNRRICNDFVSVYSHEFLNFNAVAYTPLGEYGNLLVICYPQFMDAMKPYVEWKRSEGYHTEIIDVTTAGSTAPEIRSFIADYYITKGLTHVLLVGDSPQIPTNTGGSLGGPSDNAYGYILGNDHYADVFIGRFSAENVAQVETQVLRTLNYEKNPQYLTDDWFSTVIGIGSDQGPGDDGEFDYQHIRNQQTKLLAYTYTWNPELFDGSQGGNDANGNPTQSMVTAAVDSGAGLILYTGHGSNTSWGTTGFNNAKVNQLANQGKLPFIWSVACVNGNFVGLTCFAEAWLRATKDGEPVGAVAFLGSTINQSWDSPMEGQDEMTNILSESDSLNIKRTFAGLSINGCFKMIESYGSDGENMADTWTVFGDPTIMVRTAAPGAMPVANDSIIFTGDSVLTVTCPVNGARATLTVADSILATGLISNDMIRLGFPALTNPSDTLYLVVTAYNKLPYESKVLVLPRQALVAGFTATPRTLVPGNSVSFSDTSSGYANSWNWYFPGGNPETSAERNPVIQYNSQGNFDVQLIVSRGSSTDTLLKPAYILADFPASVTPPAVGMQCSVLPNPNKGIFTFTLNTGSEDKVKLTICNVLGTGVYTENFLPRSGNITNRIDLSYLPAGPYFLLVEGKNGMTRIKIILAK
ncbi:MAG: C25 family cysteine peptidase [Bacteroidetes bacterium]|nr:C25 family cysteine peptidase [Bacteroidota bacterium]